jgi:hypothetical protein
MNADDRAKLQRILASFDEAGLVALANKGLVRRAQKDLEAGGLEMEETDAAVLVRGPGWHVTMPSEGPTRATDSTRATGLTRHILMATIFLRDRWASATAAPAPNEDARALEQALLGLGIEDLEKWAGKTIVRAALPLVKSMSAVEVEVHAGLTVRLVQQEIEARLLPGPPRRSAAALLDSVQTTAPRSRHKQWVVALVLALQQSRGRTIELPGQTVPAEPESAPLTRQQLTASARELLTGVVATGLAHPSERMVERLVTLSITAGAINLPRLARLLRALADDVALVLARSAAADTGRLFDRLCVAHALAGALAVPEPASSLVGFHRTQYDPVGDLALVGLGAHAWQTASGYEGLTVLFWDNAANRILTWTRSRPTASPGRLMMAQSYALDAVWGGASAERLSRSRFTLRQARVNGQGRLSASQTSEVADLSPAAADELPLPGRLFTHWQALHHYARGTGTVGLREPAPLDRIVVLQPAKWGERVFAEIEQQFCWTLGDNAGDTVTLTLPWAGVNEAAIAFLEAVQPERDRLGRVVVRLGVGGALTLEPLALHSHGTPAGHRVLNPAFDQALIVSRHSTLLDRLRKKFGRDRIASTLTADDETEADGRGALTQAPAGIRARLAEADGILLQLAESGLGRLNDALRTRLWTLSAAMDRHGLTELGQVLAALAEAGAGAKEVVRGGYVSRVYRQVMLFPLAS